MVSQPLHVGSHASLADTTLYSDQLTLPRSRSVIRPLSAVAALCMTASFAAAQAEKPKPKAKVERLTPTAADVAYGEHPRQKFDFWQAKSDRPTPLVVMIHGGGWVNGDKSSYGTAAIKPFLDQGISVAAVNYRFI